MVSRPCAKGRESLCDVSHDSSASECAMFPDHGQGIGPAAKQETKDQDEHEFEWLPRINQPQQYRQRSRAVATSGEAWSATL